MRKSKALLALFMCISACACLAFAACNEEQTPNIGQNQNNPDEITQEGDPPFKNPGLDPSLDKAPAEGEDGKDPAQTEKDPSLPQGPFEGEGDLPSGPEEEVPTTPLKPDQGEESPNPPKEEEPEISNDTHESDPEEPTPPDENEHEHEFSDWYYDADGYHMRYCSCGAKETQKCTMEQRTVRATCTTDGYILHTCTVCKGQFRTDVVPSNGEHVWIYSVNYDTQGYSTGVMQHSKTCQNCGEDGGAEKCTFTPIEHAPTCTEDGFNRYTCTVCSNYYDASTFYVENGVPKQKKATGHTYLQNWVHTVEEGTNLHTKTCEVCGHVEKENCLFEDTSILPTCTEEGITSHRCKICGFFEVLSKPQALGHEMSEFTPLEGDEQHVRHCVHEGCGLEIVEDCIFDRVELIRAASCKERGEENAYCACGRSKNIIVFPTGHKLKSATYPRNGADHTGICEVCEELVTESHKYGDSNLCTVCGYDGLVYNYRLKIWVEETFSGGSKPNPVNKSAKIIYISENNFLSYGDYYLTYAIGKNAFKGNTNLTEIYIPKTVQKIEPSAFDGCTSLKTIHFEGTEEEWKSCFEDENGDIAKREGITLVCNSYYYPKRGANNNSFKREYALNKKEKTIN